MNGDCRGGVVEEGYWMQTGFCYDNNRSGLETWTLPKCVTLATSLLSVYTEHTHWIPEHSQLTRLVEILNQCALSLTCKMVTRICAFTFFWQGF